MILLKDYKLAFDAAIKESIKSFGKIPNSLLDDVGTFVSAIFPPLDSDCKKYTVSVPNNLVELNNESIESFLPSQNCREVNLIETPKRREAVEVILGTKDETLSKVLNARGNSSLLLRNLQMVPAGDVGSDHINRYFGLTM